MPAINHRVRRDNRAAGEPSREGTGSLCPEANLRPLATALVAVRTRPGLHVGGIGLDPTRPMVLEWVDDAVRGSLRGHGAEVRVTPRRDGSLSAGDDGRGLPVGPSASAPSRDRLKIALDTIRA